MAVRQYIGARYVLKIYQNSQNPLSADWEAGVAYEPLTMVNYNFSSYISRKNVPGNIGNPVDNPEYWALSGLYNGQIANLQEQLDRLDDTVDGMVNTVSKNVFAGKSVIRKNLVQRPNYLKTLADTVEECSLQGAAYNSTRNTYLIAILENNGLVVHLVEISMSDGLTVVKRESFGDHILGHANDITYNPNTNLYYLCTLAEGNVNNEAVAIDPDTLEIVETIQLYPNTTVQQEGSMCIAYDEENDRYFSMSQYAIYVYDKNFNVTKTIDYPLLTSYIASYFGYSQGVVNAICAYKGYICLGIFGWASANETGIILALVDPESEETFTTWNIDSNNAYEELEGLFVKGDDIYMTSGQNFYYLSRVIIQGNPTFNKEDTTWGGGKIISADEDLDTVYAPGKYYVNANTANNVLKNNCILTVEYFGTWCVQRLWIYGGDRECTMYRHHNGTTWSTWNYNTPLYYDTVPTRILAHDIITTGYITNSAKEIDFTIPVKNKMSGAFAASLVASGSVVCRDAGKYIADGVTTNLNMVMRNLTVTTSYANDGWSVIVRLTKPDGTAFKHTDGTSITNNSSFAVTTANDFVLTHNA